MIKICTTITLLLLNLIVFAQAIPVKIKVTDADKLNLPGASVSIHPGKYQGATNQQGEIIFAAVPAGTYTLKISYLGYSDVTKTITVSSSHNYFAEVLTAGKHISNSEIIILGDRLKGQAKALNQQKNSGNITNIVSADQIGRFPDANIGDAIKRIPGITMQNDQGEARNIVIRGMGPEFNSVTFNGERIPSAEGDNRRVQMDLIPSDMIQTVEVNKTLTADMDADAIGGSVNLVTRSAPNGLRISGTLAGGYSPVRNNGFNGTANLVIGNRFAKNKLGYIVSLSYNKNIFGSDNVEAAWSKDNNGKVYINDHDIRVYDEMRIRRSAAATIDYKINQFNTVYLTGSYNWRDDKENRFRLRHRFRGNNADLIYDANGNITGYKKGEVLRQTKGGLDNNRNQNRRLEDQRIRSLALRGDHMWGKLKTDWSAQYARASEKRPNERYINMGVRNLILTQDISSPGFPMLSDNAPLNTYTRLNELTEQFQNQYEEDINGKLNFELPLSFIKEQKGSLKFGARYRSKNKVRNNNFFTYEPVTAFDNITSLPLINKTNKDFLPGSKYISGQFISADYLGSLNLKNSTLFDEEDTPSEYLAGNYNAKENISAAYLLFNQYFTENFSANAGVRFERTGLNYTGNIVTDEETLNGKVKVKKNYTDVLPGINIRYAAAKDLVIKAAWTKSIARPKYYDLVPYMNILPGDKELSAGNASLQPVRADNIDIMAEKYFKSIGLISAGVFYKKLDRFFYNYIDANYNSVKFAKDFPSSVNPIPADETWAFAQRRNGAGATLTGFEVALQQQLTFLPGMWKGLGVYFNYTYTSSKAKNLYNNEGTLVRNNVKLPGAAPHMLNASLSFENKKLVIRVSANYTSSYIDDSDDGGYNENDFYDRYYDKQFFLDANASYAFTKRLRLFAEANNLTNQPLRYYQGEQSRTAQVEFYGIKYNAGVKFDLVK